MIVIERHSYEKAKALDKSVGATVEPNHDGEILDVVSLRGRDEVDLFIKVDDNDTSTEGPDPITQEGEDTSEALGDIDELHGRAVNALQKEGYETLSDVSDLSISDLKDIDGVGPTTANTIRSLS